MKASKFLGLTFCIIALPLIYASCGDINYLEKTKTSTNNNGPDIKPQLASEFIEGSVIFDVKAPKDAAQVNAIISSSDIKDPIEYSLIKKGDLWNGIIDNVPVGDEKLAVVNAYDSSNRLQYTGKANFSVIGNNSITVVIQLHDVTSKEYNGPIIESLALTPRKVAPGESIILDVNADGRNSDDELSFAWTAAGGVFDNAESSTPLWTAPDKNGTYGLTVTVKDSENNANQITVDVEVDQKYQERDTREFAWESTLESARCHCDHCCACYFAPRVKSIIADPEKVKQGETIALTVKAIDPHHYPLTYKWRTNKKNSQNYGTFSNINKEKTFFKVNADAPTGYLKMKVVVCNKYHCTLASKKIKIEKSDKKYPVICSITANPLIIHPGESTQLNVMAKAKYCQNKLEYSWSSNCAGTFNNNISKPVFTSSPGLNNGKCELTITVKEKNNENSKSIIISIIKKNTLPSINSITINPGEIDRKGKTNISVAASDADGDALSYSWKSSCSGKFDKPDASNTIFTASYDALYGNCTISVAVSDGKSVVCKSKGLLIKKLNSPPIIHKLFANQGVADRGEPVGLFVCAIDPDKNPLTFHWTASCQGTFNNNAIEYPIFTVGPQADYGVCSIKIEVSDGTVAVSKSIQIQIEKTYINTPPEIKGITVNPAMVYPGKSVKLNVDAIDGNGDVLTYAWTSSCSGNFNDPHAFNPTFTTASNASYGNCIFSVVVRDKEYQTNGYVTVEIQKPNSPPVITGISADPENPDKDEQTQLQVDVSDIDGDTLTYSWKATCKGNFNDASISNPIFTVYINASYGDCSFVVYVDDGKTTTTGFKTIKIVEKNKPPAIATITAMPEWLDINESTQLKVDALDPNIGDILTTSWSSSCSGSFNNPKKNNPIFTIGANAAYGPCTLTVVVSDGKEQVSGSVTVMVEMKNFFPVINAITAQPVQIDRNETTHLHVYASDANGDILTYTWSSSCKGSFDNQNIIDPLFTAASDAPYGNCTLSVEVNDGKATAKDSIAISIYKIIINEAPTIISSFQTNDSADPGESIIMIIRALDPEGKNVSFEWSSTKGQVSIPVTKITNNYIESSITWTAPDCGTDPVIVSVNITDEDGLSTIKEFLPISLSNSPVCLQYGPGIEANIQAYDQENNREFDISGVIITEP